MFRPLKAKKYHPKTWLTETNHAVVDYSKHTNIKILYIKLYDTLNNMPRSILTVKR